MTKNKSNMPRKNNDKTNYLDETVTRKKSNDKTITRNKSNMP